MLVMQLARSNQWTVHEFIGELMEGMQPPFALYDVQRFLVDQMSRCKLDPPMGGLASKVRRAQDGE